MRFYELYRKAQQLRMYATDMVFHEACSNILNNYRDNIFTEQEAIAQLINRLQQEKLSRFKDIQINERSLDHLRAELTQIEVEHQQAHEQLERVKITALENPSLEKWNNYNNQNIRCKSLADEAMAKHAEIEPVLLEEIITSLDQQNDPTADYVIETVAIQDLLILPSTVDPTDLINGALLTAEQKAQIKTAFENTNEQVIKLPDCPYPILRAQPADENVPPIYYAIYNKNEALGAGALSSGVWAAQNIEDNSWRDVIKYADLSDTKISIQFDKRLLPGVDPSSVSSVNEEAQLAYNSEAKILHALGFSKFTNAVIDKTLSDVKTIAMNQEEIAIVPKQNTDLQKSNSVRNGIYLPMQFMPGTPVLKYVGALPFARIVEVGKMMGEKIQGLHDKDYIHRDIKLENFLYHFIANRLELIDYGLTVKFGTSKDKAGKVRQIYQAVSSGSKLYMAPELRFTDELLKNYSKASDIYAYGVTLALLFDFAESINPNFVIELSKFGVIKKFYPEWPPNLLKEIYTLVTKMLHDNPDKRPTIKEVNEFFAGMENHVAKLLARMNDVAIVPLDEVKQHLDEAAPFKPLRKHLQEIIRQQKKTKMQLDEASILQEFKDYIPKTDKFTDLKRYLDHATNLQQVEKYLDHAAHATYFDLLGTFEVVYLQVSPETVNAKINLDEINKELQNDSICVADIIKVPAPIADQRATNPLESIPFFLEQNKLQKSVNSYFYLTNKEIQLSSDHKLKGLNHIKITPEKTLADYKNEKAQALIVSWQYEKIIAGLFAEQERLRTHKKYSAKIRDINSLFTDPIAYMKQSKRSFLEATIAYRALELQRTRDELAKSYLTGKLTKSNLRSKLNKLQSQMCRAHTSSSLGFISEFFGIDIKTNSAKNIESLIKNNIDDIAPVNAHISAPTA